MKQSAEATNKRCNASFTGRQAADKLLTVEQVADYLGVSRAQAYLLVRRTGFPLLSLGARLLRVKRSQLEAWLESQAA